MSASAITQPEGLTAEPDPDQAGFSASLEGDAVLACVGELDPATNPALRRSLNRVLRLEPDRVVVDLSRVSFFDAGAIGELVQARITSRAAGGDLVVRAPSPFGRRVLGIVGLSNLISLDPDPGIPAGDADSSAQAGSRERVEAPDTTPGLTGPSIEHVDRFAAGGRSSVLIDEAKGLIAEHFDVDIDEASIMLHTFATAHHQSMHTIADSLMARTIDVARLNTDSLGRSAPPPVRTDQDVGDSASSSAG